MDELNGRRTRWIEYLQQFRIHSIHRPGTSPELSMADYLSRAGHDMLQKLKCLSVQIQEAVSDGVHRLTTLFSAQETKDAQQLCPAVGPVFRLLSQPVQTVDSDLCAESRRILQRKAKLQIGLDGILRYREAKGRSTDGQPLGRKRVVVLPRSLRRKVLELVHDAPLSGLMGRNRTLERIRDVVWWPWMSEDVAIYAKGCDACQRHKRPKHPDKLRLE